MKDIREEVIKRLAKTIIDTVDKTGMLPEMFDLESWLDKEYGLGDEAAELIISMLGRVK